MTTGAATVIHAIQDAVRAVLSLFRASGAARCEREDWRAVAVRTSPRVEEAERAAYVEHYVIAAREVVAGLRGLN